MGRRARHTVDISAAAAASTPRGEGLRWSGDRFLPESGVESLSSEVNIDEDFFGNSAGTYQHNYTWLAAAIGAGGTDALFLPSSAEELGLVRVTSSGTSGQGRFWYLGNSTNRLFYGTPRATSGAWLCVKIRTGATNTNATWWAGIGTPTSTGAPDGPGANSTQFLGFRAYAAGSGVNWKLCGRVGTTDTEIDLGVSANNSWVILAARRTSSGWEGWASATGSRPAKVGTLTSGYPGDTQSLSPVFGILTHSAAAKNIDIDFWRLRARFAR